MTRKNKPKPEGFWMARSVPLTVTGLTAGFAVWGVAAPAWEETPALSIFLGAVFAGSAAMTPVMLFSTAKAKGAAAAALVATCAVFGAIDAAGWGIAAARLERQLAAADVAAELAEWEARQAPLATALAAARNAEAALPLTSQVCPEGTGPKVCTLLQEGAATDRAVAAERTAKAEADLAAIGAKPQPRDLVDDHLLHAVGALIQLALALCFWGVEATRERRYREALAEWKADKAPKAAKAPTAAPVPTAEDLALAARLGPGPVLAFTKD